MPVDRKGRFSEETRRAMAVPVEEFNRSIAVEEANGLVNAAMLIGEDKLGNQIGESAQEAAEAATASQEGNVAAIAAQT